MTMIAFAQTTLPEGPVSLQRAIGFSSLSEAINTLFPLVVFFAAILAFLYMIIAAFKYITAGDHQEQTRGARLTFINAIVGLVLLALVVVAFRIIVQLIPGLSQYFSFSL